MFCNFIALYFRDPSKISESPIREERAMKDLYPMRKSLVDLSEILYWV